MVDAVRRLHPFESIWYWLHIRIIYVAGGRGGPFGGGGFGGPFGGGIPFFFSGMGGMGAPYDDDDDYDDEYGFDDDMEEAEVRNVLPQCHWLVLDLDSVAQSRSLLCNLLKLCCILLAGC